MLAVAPKQAQPSASVSACPVVAEHPGCRAAERLRPSAGCDARSEGTRILAALACSANQRTQAGELLSEDKTVVLVTLATDERVLGLRLVLAQ